MRKLFLVPFCFLLTGCDAVLKPSQERKIGDLKTPNSKFTLRCPTGESFRLLVGVPEKAVDWSQKNPHIPKISDFKGQLKITQNGNAVCSFPISSTRVSRTNWLERDGLEGGYVLQTTPAQSGDYLQPLDGCLKSGQTYDIEISFSPKQPANSSLWLAWLGR